jgi:hypothetical protein
MALQQSIDRLLQGCAARGLTLDEFLALPAHEILEFAQAFGIARADLQDICGLLMRELDAVEVEMLERASPAREFGHRTRLE